MHRQLTEPGWLGSKSYGSLIVATFVAFAFVDLPVYIRLGHVSLSSLLTLLLALALVATVRPLRIPVITAVIPLAILTVWALVSLFSTGSFSPTEAYPAFVLLSFLLVVVAASSLGTDAIHQFYQMAFSCVDLITLTLVVLNVIVYGWGSGAVEANWMLGPRSLAMFALLPLSWHVSAWVLSGARRSAWRATLWVLAIYVSLSRTAFFMSAAVAILAVLLSSRNSRGRTATLLFIVMLYGLGIGSMMLDFEGSPWRERFTGGDQAISLPGLAAEGTSRSIGSGDASVGDQAISLPGLAAEGTSRSIGSGDASVRFNTSGRANIWRAVWQSALSSPVIGKGFGSSAALLKKRFGIEHPHNEYLRVFHDLGVLGLGLLTAQFGAWAWRLHRNMVRLRGEHSDLQVANMSALLATTAVAGMALTDNPLAYPFVMLPFGLMLGRALALTLVIDGS